MTVDADEARRLVAGAWHHDILPTLHDYITIPAKSPAFDADWAANGHIDRAVALLGEWAEARDLDGMVVDVVRLDGRTPVIVCEIPAAGGPADDTVLLYGHLDKQPEMVGWDEGKGPWVPVVEGGRLYGRGGADDGYAMFASLAAVEAVRSAGGAHARLVVLIEASEESGSPDLAAYVDHLADRIGEVSLVICLDSGCATYDTLWVTTSLRGLAGGELTVRVVESGVHSGLASGIVPSSFRIARALLSRIEDEVSGRVLLDGLHAEIPAGRVAQASAAAEELGAAVAGGFPWAGGTQPVSDDVSELILNRTWRPALAITGFAGAPSPADAGNVLRPGTTLKLSVRLPPTVDPALAGRSIASALEADPPYGAEVDFDLSESGPGWDAPESVPWLAAALDSASLAAFGRPARMIGEGGSIPFMGMLGERFPAAQFVVTGVLGPGSNAHGPNEFLDLATGRRVTEAVAHLIDAHADRDG